MIQHQLDSTCCSKFARESKLWVPKVWKWQWLRDTHYQRVRISVWQCYGFQDVLYQTVSKREQEEVCDFWLVTFVRTQRFSFSIFLQEYHIMQKKEQQQTILSLTVVIATRPSSMKWNRTQHWFQVLSLLYCTALNHQLYHQLCNSTSCDANCRMFDTSNSSATSGL